MCLYVDEQTAASLTNVTLISGKLLATVMCLVFLFLVFCYLFLFLVSQHSRKETTYCCSDSSGSGWFWNHSDSSGSGQLSSSCHNVCASLVFHAFNLR